MVNLFYPNEEAKNSKLKNTEYYKQLGFDQGLIFGTMRLFGSLGDSNKIIDYVTTDIETIKYRQQVFDDFKKNTAFRASIEKIIPHLQELLDMRKQNKESGDTTAHLYSICDMDLYFTTLTELDSIFKEATGLQSQALIDFGKFIAEKVSAPEFADMQKRVAAAMDEVKNIKSITIGINLDAQLYPKEAGIVSINKDVYKSGNVVDKVLRAEIKNDEYTCMSPLEIVTRGMAPDEVNAVYDALNNALDVIRKAERGEKIEYATLRNRRQTTTMQEQMPKHYFVANEIRQHPDKAAKSIVLVIDREAKSADVILPAGASTEANNEIPGMNKGRIERALQKEGIEQVRFYNTDGALGYRPDDSYFNEKMVTLARLRNYTLEKLSTLDVSEAVRRANEVGFDAVQMIQDDKNRWALYIKPENKEGYSVYPDKEDVNRFFSTLKQAMDNIDKVRMELAHKYYALAEVKPDLKVDLFGSDTPEIDLNRIQRVAIFKTRQDGIQCVATIDGQKLQPRSVTPQQWQRMWVAEDRDGYKRHLAATLFADVLQKGQSVGEQKAEEQVRQQNEVVAENRSEETNDENMSPKRQFWDNLKEKHPDALYLIRAGEVYRLYNEDAAKGADILGITMKKYPERGFSAFAEFPRTQLDSYLPKLVRAGERVAISEIELQDKRQDEQETHRGIHR